MNPTAVGFIIGAILIVITVLLILWGNKKDNARIDTMNRSVTQPVAPQKPVASAAVAAPAAPVVQAPPREDDLTLIEGIGPKISSLLKENNITTFAQLAASEVALLETILRENRLQIAKPDSWPEQARLAAAGRMDELKALQDTLIGGR
jgi:predicted flap endonuclease-1-like 5' DNA nuclease